MNRIEMQPIGIIRSPFAEPAGTPIQRTAGAEGTVEIYPPFAAGLRDIEGFSHLILVFCFHLARPAAMLQTPFLDDVERGVFAIRSPSRPNPIGLSVVELLAVEGARLRVRGVDMVDGTPLLDIKPYIPEIDSVPGARRGWLEGKTSRFRRVRDDGRFADPQGKGGRE
ncbi:MAG: tRNA (N6-threonylcarbamoyladenosine(37)-N6)-methyltransferase TrmO [Candidatus Krumholzibacteriota bacterium]|nr:tRNA (N6-threonylcarbamoyladenosine(37)-N6)-methyltransferase TrmO [Candidatus Krumholzibacteriota bacterium]